MFGSSERKAYRDKAKESVFSHISFALWAVICSDFVVTLITSYLSAMAVEKNINIYSQEVDIFIIRFVVTILAGLVNLPLAFCARRAYLVISRASIMEPLSFGNLFVPFGSVGFLLKGSLVLLLNELLVFLGCFGLLVLAIPVSYAYSMSVFVLADNPEISPIKALSMSRRMMKGKKWGTFLTVLPLTALSVAVSMLLGRFPLLATFITSVIMAIEYVAFAIIYDEIKLRENV